MGYQPSNENKREKCIWELRVASQRDLWLHLDKAKFADKSCDNGRIEIYLAGRLEPRFIICPENVSLARDLTILSAAELGALDNENEPLPVLIQYTGHSNNLFRLVWTELFHLPRKTDGTVATNSMLKSSGDWIVWRHVQLDQKCTKMAERQNCEALLNNWWNTFFDTTRSGIIERERYIYVL